MNPLTRYEPLVGRLDGLFNEFFRPAFVWETARRAEAAADPLGREARRAEAYTVAAELPGVKKDDIHVEIEGNEVTISAETQARGRREGRREVAAHRALLRQDRPPLRAAAGHRRGEGRGEVRQRRARAHAAQEGRRSPAASSTMQ